MAVDAHLEGLSTRHRALEKMIEREMAHASVDYLKLSELKRQKLRIKDEMERLRQAEAARTPR